MLFLIQLLNKQLKLLVLRVSRSIKCESLSKMNSVQNSFTRDEEKLLEEGRTALRFIPRALSRKNLLLTLENRYRERLISASAALSIIAPDLPLPRYLSDNMNSIYDVYLLNLLYYLFLRLINFSPYQVMLIAMICLPEQKTFSIHLHLSMIITTYRIPS